MSDKKQVFLNVISSFTSDSLVFTEHFNLRAKNRGISKKLVEDYLINTKTKLKYVQELISISGFVRYKCYYEFSGRRILLIISDLKDLKLIIVTSMFIDSRKFLEVIRNANK